MLLHHWVLQSLVGRKSLGYVFIDLFLAALGLRCCMGSSLVAESGGYSLDAQPGL